MTTGRVATGPASRGRLVVFEGVEGAGKSTQVARLLAWLDDRGEGPGAVAIREPGTSPAGTAIREILLDPNIEINPRTETLLFLAARAQLVANELAALLESGVVVLCDRFFLSTYAYQGAGRGLDVDTIRQLNSFAVRGLIPDATILLDVHPSVGMNRATARGRADRIEGAGAEFHQRVYEAFRSFAQPEWQREHPECGPIVTVDADGSETEVFERLLAGLSGVLPETFPPGVRS